MARGTKDVSWRPAGSDGGRGGRRGASDAQGPGPGDESQSATGSSGSPPSPRFCECLSAARHLSSLASGGKATARCQPDRLAPLRLGPWGGCRRSPTARDSGRVLSQRAGCSENPSDVRPGPGSGGSLLWSTNPLSPEVWRRSLILSQPWTRRLASSV